MLAVHGAEARRRGKEIKAATLRFPGDDSRGEAGDLNDIGVGHECSSMRVFAAAK